MQDKLKDLFDRAVEQIRDTYETEEPFVYEQEFDPDTGKLTSRVEFDDIEQTITLQYEKANPMKGFELGYDRVYVNSTASEIGTVITDQTNTAFEDEESVSRVVEEIYTQITNPLSNTLDVLFAQEAVDSEDYGQWI